MCGNRLGTTLTTFHTKLPHTACAAEAAAAARLGAHCRHTHKAHQLTALAIDRTAVVRQRPRHPPRAQGSRSCFLAAGLDSARLPRHHYQHRNSDRWKSQRFRRMQSPATVRSRVRRAGQLDTAYYVPGSSRHSYRRTTWTYCPSPRTPAERLCLDMDRFESAVHRCQLWRRGSSSRVILPNPLIRNPPLKYRKCRTEFFLDRSREPACFCEVNTCGDPMAS